MSNRNRWLAVSLAAVALGAAACGSSTSTTPAASGGGQPSAAAPSSGGSSSAMLTSAKIGGATVLTNSKGFTLYTFARDTATTSNCTGKCATSWPPVTGPASVHAGINGKVGMITRADGSIQATYDGHPLYTFSGDTASGQNHGNGINTNGGLWKEITLTASAPGASPSSSSTGNGAYGY
jgi:predicted lipoprotein with Yx(FWY)xxD motif